MLRVHKRKKTSRIRGSRTAGWGFRQKHKGPGNKGGRGMAGSGKKADQKKQKAVSMDAKKKKYFGKQGLTSRNNSKKKELKINLSEVKDNYFKKAGDKIDLSKYVILGNGEGFKAEIMALRASKSAVEKMSAAGGKIVLPEVKVEDKKDTKEVKSGKKVEEKKDVPEKPSNDSSKKVTKKTAKRS